MSSDVARAKAQLAPEAMGGKAPVMVRVVPYRFVPTGVVPPAGLLTCVDEAEGIKMVFVEAGH